MAGAIPSHNFLISSLVNTVGEHRAHTRRRQGVTQSSESILCNPLIRDTSGTRAPWRWHDLWTRVCTRRSRGTGASYTAPSADSGWSPRYVTSFGIQRSAAATDEGPWVSR